MSRLEGLNIIDFNEHCRRFLYYKSLYCRYVYCSLKSLQNVIKDRLDIASKYHIESRFHEYAKEAEKLIHLLVTDTDDMSQALVDLDLLGDTRILNFNYSNDLMATYFLFVLKRMNRCKSQSEAETIARKVLGSFTVMQLDSTVTVENSFQAVFMMQTLHFCYRMDVRDSEVVADLVKLSFDKTLLSNTDHGLVPILDSVKYMLYLLEHCRVARFDISSYDCRREEVGLSPFREMFSILNSASKGDSVRTRLLLQYGLEDDYTDDILISEDLRNPFPAIGLRMGSPNRPYLMVLRMMHALNLRLSWESSNPDSDSRDKKKTCFFQVWNSIPDPYVTSKEFLAAIANEGARKTPPDEEEEIVHVLTQVVYLYKVYVDNFPEVAYQVAQPRSLKHLGRCAVRRQLKACGELPSGISSLHIPSSLQQYLNLD